MHPDMRNVRGHELNSVIAARFEVRPIASRIELQNLCSKLKALRPFGPAPARIAAIDGEYRRAFRGLPTLIQRIDFLGGEFKESLDFRPEVFGGKAVLYLNHRSSADRWTKQSLGVVEAESFPRLH